MAKEAVKTAEPRTKNQPRIERFYWSVPDDILALTHGGELPMPLIPEGMRSLAGSAAESQIGVLIRLRDADGKIIGLASELEISPGPHSTVEGVQVLLSIVIPGRGTLVAYEVKGYDVPGMAEIMERVQKTGEPWTGEMKSVSTIGPAEDGRGIVLAGTGDFQGAVGHMHQTITWHRISTKDSETNNEETFWLTPLPT